MIMPDTGCETATRRARIRASLPWPGGHGISDAGPSVTRGRGLPANPQVWMSGNPRRLLAAAIVPAAVAALVLAGSGAAPACQARSSAAASAARTRARCGLSMGSSSRQAVGIEAAGPNSASRSRSTSIPVTASPG